MSERTDIPSLTGRLRLNNMALAVGNLNAMIHWYETALGFAIAERGRFDNVGADYAMLDGAGMRLELVTRPASNQYPVDRTMPPDHLSVLGWKALVLETDDLAAVTATLAAHGADMLWADEQLSVDRRSTMIRDPEGNLIHIFGPRQV
jgi:catechol 2,3-dioxygenase-like lactoylglutathione lyase family enzyme